eukprot:6005230-Alexandrium_andersonii.AAC.1
MSASLVGSEMCIRDRLPQDPPPTRPVAIQSFGCVVFDEAGQVLMIRAVSYTHLTLPTICSV